MKTERSTGSRAVSAIRRTGWVAAAIFVLSAAASGCGEREVSSPVATEQASPSIAVTTQAGPSTATTTQAGSATTTQAAPPPATPTQPQASRSTATTKRATPSPVTQIRTVDAKQVRALVDAHKGKVVVLNFWATWCPPCVREFPALIKAYEQYHDKGMNMYAVSMNSPEEMADIKEFVQTHKPPFPIYLKDEQDATFNEAMLEEWFGEMPMTLVFDTAGKRVLAHTAEITFEELSGKVEPLLPRQ